LRTIYLNMKRPAKKASTRLVVDEYEKFYRGQESLKQSKNSEANRKEQYNRFIDEELQEAPNYFREIEKKEAPYSRAMYLEKGNNSNVTSMLARLCTSTFTI
jgi:hypothetical protein